MKTEYGLAAITALNSQQYGKIDNSSYVHGSLLSLLPKCKLYYFLLKFRIIGLPLSYIQHIYTRPRILVYNSS